ncbi:MAG: intradiol ring-cleavage dioxygenase [Chloroflexota bacterium]|nr:intradiol ring-cleavage dioxygenase [Chloroflexota bacterium]
MTDKAMPRRLLTRRRTLGLIGAAGVAGLAAAVGCNSSDNTATATATRSASATGTAGATATSAATSAATATATASAQPVINCAAVPALTEGPYFVDELLNRSDIRTDPTTGAASPGTPLDIAVRVFNGACSPLAGAHVDIWHCDAAGKYSDESANNTVGQKFLRGYQVTDEIGAVKFTTVYPGWYMGRAVHIHFKIRTYDGSSQTSAFTSQFFFDDAQTDATYQQTPYSSRGSRDTRNSGDSIYGQSAGNTVLTLTPSGNGYASSFGIGMHI